MLKSTKSSGYGVELGGDPSRAMQVRTVAFAAPGIGADTVADVVAETEFCDDFSKLQEMIRADGGELSLVKALGIGTTSVKRILVAAPGASDQAFEAPTNSNSRKL